MAGLRRFDARGLRELPKKSDKKLILYVEDDEDNWETARLNLHRRFRLLWARTSQEACQHLVEHGPDLSAILMDIELKGSDMDGIELTKMIRGRIDAASLPKYAKDVPRLDVPVLFVTAYGAKYSEEALRAVGGDRRIDKPVRFGELSIALETVDVQQLSSVALALVRGEVQAGGMSGDTEFERRSRALIETGLTGGAALDDADTLRSAGLCVVLASLLPPEAKTILTVCLRRAIAAKNVARVVCPERNAEAFALGFLLDAGLILRARYDPEGAIELAKLPAGARIVWERARGEEVHPRRAAFLAKDWRFPRDLCEAAGQHHAPTDDGGPIAQVAALAETIAAVFEGGNAAHAVQRALEGLRQAGFSDDEAKTLLDTLPKDVVRAEAAMTGQSISQGRSYEVLTNPDAVRDELDRCYHQTLRTLDEIGSQHQSLIRRHEYLNSQLTAARDRDRTMASSVHGFFLPPTSSISHENVEVCAFHRAAEQTSGDWWAFDDGRLLVGDVTGHGIDAALIVASVSGSYRALRRASKPTDELLQELHEEVRRTVRGRYAVALSALELHDGRLRWWSAGAPPILVLGRDGKIEELVQRGTMLGADVDQLEPGFVERSSDDIRRLLVFTDGAAQRRKVLRAALEATADAPCADACGTIVASADAARGNAPQTDDMTVVLMDVSA